MTGRNPLTRKFDRLPPPLPPHSGRDSQFTAPEPEFALVLKHRGDIVASTIANDVSAWDIKRGNQPYLP